MPDLKPSFHDSWNYGYTMRKERLTEEDVAWLRNNLGNGGWFYTWEPGMVHRILCFREREDLLLFKVACGT